MRRSGALLIILSAIALLTACVADGSHSSGQTTAPPGGRSCPSGFAEALQLHIAAATGNDVSVVEDTGLRHEPPALGEAVVEGCVASVEQTIPNGIMVQVVGVTTDATLDGTLDALNSAGWVQPFPESEPWAYESEERAAGGNQNLASLGVFTTIGTDPVFGFADWADYFGATAVVLQWAPAA
jgi:hypothetical protein